MIRRFGRAFGHIPRTRMLLAAFTLGGATAIGVAWGVAWSHPAWPFRVFQASNAGYGKRRATEATPDPFPYKWYVWVRTDPGLIRKQFMVDKGHELTIDDVRRFESLASDSASRAALRRHAFLLHGKDLMFVDFSVVSFGWPLPCLAAERAFTVSDSRARRLMLIDFPSDAEEAYSPDPHNPLVETYSTLTVRGHVLPTHPLWPGLAANTILYGLIWAGVLLSVGRFFCRQRAGRCGICGYDLRGLTTAQKLCPECGHARS